MSKELYLVFLVACFAVICIANTASRSLPEVQRCFSFPGNLLQTTLTSRFNDQKQL